MKRIIYARKCRNCSKAFVGYSPQSIYCKDCREIVLLGRKQRKEMIKLKLRLKTKERKRLRLQAKEMQLEKLSWVDKEKRSFQDNTYIKKLNRFPSQYYLID